MSLAVERVRQLHRTLRGQCYALAPIEKALELIGQAFDDKAKRIEARQRWFDQLLRRLTAVDFARRGAIAIEAATSVILRSESPALRANAMAILRRIVLFPTPVRLQELLASINVRTLRAAEPETPESAERAARAAIDFLVRNNLLLVVEKKTGDPAWTAHTVMRQHLLRGLGRPIGEVPSELGRLALSAFSDESAVPPIPPPRTEEGARLIERTTENLLKNIDGAVYKDYSIAPDTSMKTARSIRAAFGLISSRWRANTIPQQFDLADDVTAGSRENYTVFNTRLVRLANAIRVLQEEQNALWFSGRKNEGEIRDKRAVLYADELSWLYNELGMVGYSQGSVNDAYALFRTGQDFNAYIEGNTHGPRGFQSELNLAGVHIEAGNLPRARYHLENATRVAQKLDDEARARADGYMGLLHHLSGKYVERGTTVHKGDQCAGASQQSTRSEYLLQASGLPPTQARGDGRARASKRHYFELTGGRVGRASRPNAVRSRG